jgi:hypothetical protein
MKRRVLPDFFYSSSGAKRSREIVVLDAAFPPRLDGESRLGGLAQTIIEEIAKKAEIW